MSELKFFATHVPAAPGFMVVSAMHEPDGTLSPEFSLMPIVAWLVESTPVRKPDGWQDFHSSVTPLTLEGSPDGLYAIWCPRSKQYVIEHECAFDRVEDLMAHFKQWDKSKRA